MRTQRYLAVMIGLMLVPAVALAQKRPPLPERGPSPLLYVLLSGPAGSRVTLYQGNVARELPSPVKVGLRPGYVYRVKLSNLPNRPGVSVYPTLEVRGSLHAGPEVNPARFPAGVQLAELDVESLLTGSLLTKVVYLEDPRKAIPELAAADRPFEIELSPERDLLDEARQYGRPVLTVRAGDRDASEAELKAQSVPDTILMPGEATLGAPTLPPMLPAATFQWYDPILGPKPAEEECLKDGGDAGRPVGLDQEGKLQGLDPEDTVAEYRDCNANKKVAISNRVCLCVPRFGVLRTECRPDFARRITPPGGVLATQTHDRIDVRANTVPYSQFEQAVVTRATMRPSGFENVTTTSVVGRIDGLTAFVATLQVADVTGVCEEKPVVPEKPLYLCKSCDRSSAVLGDVVTYTITFSNQGGKLINDVVISDSLTGRLDYVPGSAKSSRQAVFTTQTNESGSKVLRWSIAGKLLPGETGTVTFQAQVR